MAQAMLQGIPAHYRAAAHIYRMCGCNKMKAAKAIGISRNTLADWMGKGGDWDGWSAAVSLENIADEMEAHEEGAKATIRQARGLVERMMDVAMRVQIEVEKQLDTNKIDDFTINAAANSGKSAIECASKLYQWATKHEVNHNVTLLEAVAKRKEELGLQLVEFKRKREEAS